MIQPLFGSGTGQPERELKDRLKEFTSVAHPHKVYLHLDRNSYKAGETIWFKAYLLDGVTHVPHTPKSNMYVELINSDGNAMEMRILIAERGFAKGDIRLPLDLPDGNYVIRGYTDWMRNFGEDHYFTQYLYIESPGYENKIPRADARRNRRFNRRLDMMEADYNIAFFPEGGNLLQGTDNRVAFKVVDVLGRGQDAEGEIIDENRNVVSRFRTDFNGIGVLEIEPQAGVNYRARVSVNGSRSSDYEFPEVAAEGYALRIDRSDGKIDIRVVSSVNPDNPLYSDELILIGHIRGVPWWGETLPLNGGNLEISIEESLFPTGIAHITVFSDEFVPLAERLIFVDRGDILSFSPHTAVIDDSGNFNLQIVVNDEKGEPARGSFSLSAVAGRDISGMYADDILSYVLLSSDLKGVIEDPYIYFQNDADPAVSVDRLLMTHGWRRFTWENVVAGELPEIRYAPEHGLAIAGRIMDPAKNESLTNYPVELKIITDSVEVFETRTGRNGQFGFGGLVYYGTVQMQLSSRRLPANYPPVIELSAHRGRGYDYVPGIYTGEQRVTQRGSDWSRVRGVSRSPYAYSGDRQVTPQLYGVPDQTIFIDHSTSTERNLFEVLRNRATGLSYDGGQIIIRGQSSIMMSNEARFMVDGMFVGRDVFLNMYPRDVERIEIFRGTSAAIFGVRGGTGVILAYTRRPGYQGFDDVMELMMLGYHQPREFYTDYVEISDLFRGKEKPERTIHWEPDLTTDENGSLNLSFPASGITDKLRIRIEGTGYEGRIGSYELNIDLEH